MKKLRFSALLLAVCILAALPASAVTAPELSAPRVIVGEAEGERIFFEAEADTKCPPASITKIMTLLLAVEAVERGEVGTEDMVTASYNCRFDLTDDSSTAYIYSGETMSLLDLLYCAALVSANEACNIIAEYVAGSVGGFVERMNARARELGCENTHFVNTHGLPDEEHYTTARDLYTIARECMRHELFRTLVGTVSYDTAPTNANGARHLSNSNALINSESPYSDKYYYKSARGIKTGRTDAAGFCLVSAARRNGLDLIAVVLGAEGDKEEHSFYSFADSIALYDWVFENFAYHKPVKAGLPAGEQPVSLGKRTAKVPLRTAGEITAITANDVSFETLEKELVLDNKIIECPVLEGSVVGEMRFTDPDGYYLGSVPVETAKSLDRNAEVTQITLVLMLAATFVAGVSIPILNKKKTKGGKR